MESEGASGQSAAPGAAAALGALHRKGLGKASKCNLALKKLGNTPSMMDCVYKAFSLAARHARLGMRDRHILQIDAGDPLAAALYDVLDTVGQLHVPVTVDMSHVACGKPAVCAHVVAALVLRAAAGTVSKLEILAQQLSICSWRGCSAAHSECWPRCP